MYAIEMNLYVSRQRTVEYRSLGGGTMLMTQTELLFGHVLEFF